MSDNFPPRVWIREKITERTYHLIGNAPQTYHTRCLLVYLKPAERPTEKHRIEYLSLQEHEAKIAELNHKIGIAKAYLNFIEIESRDGSRHDFKRLINDNAKGALEKLK